MEATDSGNRTQYRILYFVSTSHFLIDLITSVVPAMLLVLQKNLSLTYVQLGTVVMVSNLTSSMLQPFLGYLTDRRPTPWLLPVAALFAGMGLAGIANATTYPQVLLMVMFIGLASAAFHPEGSRVAYLAAGPRRGLAQSIFQVGGNGGQAVGPLMIPLLMLPFGLQGAYWLLIPAVIGMITLAVVGRWYKQQTKLPRPSTAVGDGINRYGALVLLVAVVSLRSWIHSGIASFLPLFYENARGMTISLAEYYLFVFLLAGAIGTLLGGPLADRFGKKNMLMFSMVGGIPFILLIPYLTGAMAFVNLFVVGFISLSSFAVTVVYAQELLPGKVGMVSGLMIGFAIGAGGIGASVMGKLADLIGISSLIQLLVLIPVFAWLLGMWLPDDRRNSHNTGITVSA